jgi:hypothetical protein
MGSYPSRIWDPTPSLDLSFPIYKLSRLVLSSDLHTVTQEPGASRQGQESREGWGDSPGSPFAPVSRDLRVTGNGFGLRVAGS